MQYPYQMSTSYGPSSNQGHTLTLHTQPISKLEDRLQNKASRKGEIMVAYSCQKVLLIAQQIQNIGKVGLGQGSYIGYSVFQKF